jgi:hypothetical protein
MLSCSFFSCTKQDTVQVKSTMEQDFLVLRDAVKALQNAQPHTEEMKILEEYAVRTISKPERKTFGREIINLKAIFEQFMKKYDRELRKKSNQEMLIILHQIKKYHIETTHLYNYLYGKEQEQLAQSEVPSRETSPKIR